MLSPGGTAYLAKTSSQYEKICEAKVGDIVFHCKVRMARERSAVCEQQ